MLVSDNLWIFFWGILKRKLGFPSGSDGKESTCNTGDPDSIPGLGRSPGEENDNPLRCSCLGNPMDREACWATGGHKRVRHNLVTKQRGLTFYATEVFILLL